MKIQHYDFFTPIIDWANERGILEEGRLTKQLLKSTEECSELQNAIESYENGNKEALIEIKDAIGDVYVTLVISTQMKLNHPYIVFRKIKLRENSLIIPTDFKFYTIELKRLDLDLYTSFTGEITYDLDLKIAKHVEFLDFLAKTYDLKLIDCIEFAYNTISKRKGKMIDGSFVKEK